MMLAAVCATPDHQLILPVYLGLVNKLLLLLPRVLVP